MVFPLATRASALPLCGFRSFLSFKSCSGFRLSAVRHAATAAALKPAPLVEEEPISVGHPLTDEDHLRLNYIQVHH